MPRVPVCFPLVQGQVRPGGSCAPRGRARRVRRSGVLPLLLWGATQRAETDPAVSRGDQRQAQRKPGTPARQGALRTVPTPLPPWAAFSVLFPLTAMVAGLGLGFGLGLLVADALPSPVHRSPEGEGGCPPPPCLTRVVDGDTLRVRYRPSRPLEESVRLLCVDTPERGEPGYAEARAALEEMVRGKRITLEWEQPGHPERDNFGRLLAYVFADGVNVNVELVRGGWSRYERGYGEGSHAAAFRRAEAEARSARRGLWAERLP